MAVFLVIYDLRNESGSQDYEPLWDELNRLDAHRVQDSAWLVSVNNTAKELHDHIKAYVDSDDRLLVSRFTTSHWYSNARAGTNNWLKENPPE